MAKAKHEENIIKEEIFRRRIQEELNTHEMKLQIKSKRCEKRNKIVNEEKINVRSPEYVLAKFDGTSFK